jgi:hypothetical protein
MFALDWLACADSNPPSGFYGTWSAMSVMASAIGRNIAAMSKRATAPSAANTSTDQICAPAFDVELNAR